MIIIQIISLNHRLFLLPLLCHYTFKFLPLEEFPSFSENSYSCFYWHNYFLCNTEFCGIISDFLSHILQALIHRTEQNLKNTVHPIIASSLTHKTSCCTSGCLDTQKHTYSITKSCRYRLLPQKTHPHIFIMSLSLYRNIRHPRLYLCQPIQTDSHSYQTRIYILKTSPSEKTPTCVQTYYKMTYFSYILYTNSS